MASASNPFSDLLAKMGVAHSRDDDVNGCFANIERPAKDDELKEALAAAWLAHEEVVQACQALSAELRGPLHRTTE